ncbi:MAG: YgiQ family radical SAM protein [Nanoarchaeota archaeon]|nr:YgiQ family radical SAM protein [Nanoarchaeota archaeon]MBU1644657.1 YgiQ family radical SAM protein [Nanoarchaeota archaeon]MBU1976972.1 YgiQ family radical SAM protein [Nanoarchaeota archaeon]
MEYDIIFVMGEVYFDHPLCGVALLKRLLEKNHYKVGVIEKPITEHELKVLGRPRLFFAVTSGAIDSMVRNYTPLKKKRSEDEYSDYDEEVPDRAVTVYCNWLKKNYKDIPLVIGGTEATLRRFVHYDYWQNRLRKSILLDSRADLLVYGCGEKQILETAARIKNGKNLEGIEGTCIVSRTLPEDFKDLPSEEEVIESKEKFCQMQMMLGNNNLAQKTGNRYVLQYQSPKYTPADLDEYYELPFTREIPMKRLRSFEFSVVTHRGCLGGCSFCAIKSIHGDKIVSRSEESILREIKGFARYKHFKGNVDDLGGPSANMYGMDCNKCSKTNCIDCPSLDKSHSRLINLLRKARTIPGIKKVNIRSGIRYDLAPKGYIKEVAEHHLYDTLRIAPEHSNEKILKLMNKDRGNLKEFINYFNSLKCGKELSFYYMTAHPGSSMKEAKELLTATRKMRILSLQIFTPTPMTLSTCMYYTGIDPKTMKQIYVPYSYREKKDQKNIVLGVDSPSGFKQVDLD